MVEYIDLSFGCKKGLNWGEISTGFKNVAGYVYLEKIVLRILKKILK